MREIDEHQSHGLIPTRIKRVFYAGIKCQLALHISLCERHNDKTAKRVPSYLTFTIRRRNDHGTLTELTDHRHGIYPVFIPTPTSQESDIHLAGLWSAKINTRTITL